MQKVGASFREAGVTAIYLLDGSCVGPDIPGVWPRFASVFSSDAAFGRFGSPLRRATQFAHYTEGYARLFETAINPPSTASSTKAAPIPVRLFEWSGENHHLGRADGAIRLIQCLASLDPQTRHHVLLWGHGHAGNVFALLTNLLGADRETLDRFFKAADIYYRWPVARCVDIPVWDRVRNLLARGNGRLPAEVLLDVITFGTPIRYGWDSTGYTRLLHFVYRRLAEDASVHRAPFPPKVDDVLEAARGDYVQQLGIAGTDRCPSIDAWRARLANRRLGRLLEANLDHASPADRFETGTIVADEGTTLLVDYGRPRGGMDQHHAGHAVYTQRDWLLFHAEEVAELFHSAKTRRAA